MALQGIVTAISKEAGKPPTALSIHPPTLQLARHTGYVLAMSIDHVQALKHGGADSPSNMQWQTKQAARAKDKWE